jgi:hypothetical protein
MTMGTLTDRYVWAVVRSLPEKQRADIDRELRASIGDALEARTEAGADAPAAERATLMELGDPSRLAADYADRPAFLIGPRYYFDYVRLLKLLYVIVLPIVALALPLAQLVAGAPVGEVIGSTVSVLFAVAVHLAFWVTLVFAVLDRTEAGKGKPFMEWQPDMLPELPQPKNQGVGIAELVVSTVFLLFFAGALVWQQFYSVFTDDAGNPVPLLNPDLWSFWIPYTLVLIALELVFAVVLYARRRWSWGLAVANVVLNIAFVVPAVWLTLGDRVINPEFVENFGWKGDVGPWVIGPILVVPEGSSGLQSGLARWEGAFSRTTLAQCTLRRPGSRDSGSTFPRPGELPRRRSATCAPPTRSSSSRPGSSSD